MANGGWIKIYRSIEDWEFYFDGPFDKAHAWLDLLLMANREPKTISVRGNVVRIERGEIGHSETTLSKRWGWSREKVRRFLTLLKTRQQIRQHKNFILSKISIVNYDQYQKNETADETAEKQQKNSRRAQTRRKENHKKEREEKKEELTPSALPRAEGEDRSTEQPETPEPTKTPRAPRTPSLVDQVVLHFFASKGWEPKGPTFRRYLRAGKEVLAVCEGDVLRAKEKIDQTKAWADRKQLSWSLETILKLWEELENPQPENEQKKKAYIEGDRAYQNARGDWMIIPKDGGEHLKWEGPLNAIVYG
jgi:hypothetical protein